ncbi:MAG: hypothetical protein BWK77_05685, partial [Verrucomicrobia bacterium A1]
MNRKTPQILFLLIALAAAGLPGAVCAASKKDDGKQAALTAGRAALEDGLFDIAEKQLKQYLRRAATREDRVEGTLLFARALFGQGRYRDCVDLLNRRAAWARGTETEEAFAYWTGRAQYELGDYTGALKTSEALRQNYPDSPYRPAAARLRAKCYVRTRQFDEALELYAAIQKKHGDSPEAPDNLLDWSGTLIDLGRRDEARGILENLVGKYPASEAAVQARLWMGKLYADQREWNKALDALLVLAKQEDARADRRAAAWMAIAELYETQTNLAAAVDALEQGGQVVQDPRAKLQSDVYRGRLLVRSGRVDEGLALLRNAVKAMPTDRLAGNTQLDLAQALLDQNLHEKALAEFQRYLDAFSDPAGSARAQMGRGWSLWGLGRYAEAAAAFEKAHSLQTDPAEKAQSLLKAADACFANQQFSLAADRYDRVVADYPDSPLAARARFHSAECLAQLGRRADAEKAFLALAEAPVQELFTRQAFLRLARLKEDSGQWEQAMAAYDRVAASCTNDAICARALHGRGLIRYRLGQFKEALDDFERVVNDYPAGEVAEQAVYMRGWCLYLLGNDDRALALCEDFIRQYPKSVWAPDVLFWLGEYHYNHGNHAQAESRFAELAERYPDGALAEAALYWAGRAASVKKEYIRAIEYYTRLAKNHPDSPKIAEARFAQGDALSELGQFATAILAFEEVIARFSKSYLVDLAWGRKGDCQFTLGKDDPKRYEEAMVSYQTVRNGPRAGRD